MKAIALFALHSLAACASIPPARGGPVAGIGQVAWVMGVQIRPLEVIEDSRCPALARCVWQGRLVVRAEVSGSGWRQVRDLELGVPQPVDQYRVALIGAEPPKAAPMEIPAGEYRFKFAVSGR